MCRNKRNKNIVTLKERVRRESRRKNIIRKGKSLKRERPLCGKRVKEYTH